MNRNRRRALAAGVGLAAASMGLGWALRRQWTQPSAAPTPALDPVPPADLWSQRFDAPSGGEIALAAFRGRPLVLNFWATWCAPCVEELPLLDRFEREHRSAGWQVVGLALDGAEPVREFLGHTPVAFPIGLASGRGVGLSRSLGNAQGGLPFSVAFDKRGMAFARRLGVLSWTELMAWAAQVR